MRLALVTDGIFPYVIGGMQKHSFYLAKYLAQRGVEIDLYHYNDSAFDINKLEFFSDAEKQNINSIVLNFPSRGFLPGHYVRNSKKYSDLIFHEFINQKPVDFIYCKGFTAYSFIKSKIKGNLKTPIGVNFHGYEMFQTAPDLKSAIQQKLLLQFPVKYIAHNSDFLFSYGGKISPIIQSLGVDNKKIIEIPSGIDESWILSTITKPGTTIKFLFVGRFERRKGIEELNRVLRDLVKTINFQFHFIGDVPETHRIKHSKILYHGIISDSIMLKDKMMACDVLVCPSHSEGMPNVILEAMACGLAVIATDVGAVSEMVSKKNGILIKPNDTLMLKNAIETIVDMDIQTLNKLKEASNELVKSKFLWSNIADHIMQFLSRFKN